MYYRDIKIMHIAFLTTEYPIGNFKSGGIGTSISNLAPQLKAQGVAVTILFWGLNSSDVIKTEDGIDIVPVKRITLPLVGAIASRLQLVSNINRIVKERQIDLVEVADWEGNYSFGNITCPVIMRMHCSNLYFGKVLNIPVPDSLAFLERRAVRKANAYIACSQQVFDVSDSIFGIDKKKPARVIYNLVNQDKISQYRKDFNLNHKIIFYGTVVDKKGVKQLPKIFNAVALQYPDAELFVVGKDTIENGMSLSQTIKKQVDSSFQSRFHIVGPLPYENLLQMVAECSICLLPSKAEGMPLVLIEGMMLQKCIVTSNIPCLKEVSTHEKDVMQCPVENVSAYVQAINRIFQDEEFARKLSSNALSSAQKIFSKDLIIKSTVEFYKCIIK